MALGSTQPLSEMSTSYLSEDKGRPARKADNLTDIFWVDCLENVGASTSHSPVTGIALPLFVFFQVLLCVHEQIVGSKYNDGSSWKCQTLNSGQIGSFVRSHAPQLPKVT
jgi:hypothetical protein